MVLLLRANVTQATGKVDALPDGDATSPAIHFADPYDQQTGVYRKEDYTLGITSNGSDQLVIGPGYVDITGTATATAFVGDGSGLSAIQASNVDGLTDALDIIDCSSVTTNVLTVDGSTTVGGHILPSANVTYDVGSTIQRFRDLYLSGNTIDLAGALIQALGGNVFIQNLDVGSIRGDGSGITGIKLPPSINTITITNASWTPIDDTALSTSSTGYLVIDGGNFETGTNVSIGGTAAASITVVNSTTLRVSVNPKTTGTYDVVVETEVGSAIKVNAVSFDPVPVWQTGTSLGTVYDGTPFSITLAASDGGSNVTYSNTTALPPSTILATNGTLTGNITETSSTTYNFSVEAIDAQLQSAIRSFSLLYSYFSASGGTVTTSGAYKYHRFTTNGTFSITASRTVEYLVVGGGGGGGTDAGGGGGAGQVLVGSVVFTDGTYTVTIGLGGVGGAGAGQASTSGWGKDGGSTSLGPYTAIGGGGGGNYYYPNGRSGASGGGGGGFNTGTGGAAQGVSTGYAGGSTVASNYSAAGGGGAGGVGSAPTGSGASSAGGVGGTAVNVFGNFYGGGGGGGSYTGAGGAGGGGGAGAGGTIHTTDGYDASPNTGSGGGGGGGNNTTDGYGGGTGGSGVVIVRYLS